MVPSITSVCACVCVSACVRVRRRASERVCVGVVACTHRLQTDARVDTLMELMEEPPPAGAALAAVGVSLKRSYPLTLHQLSFIADLYAARSFI